MTTAQPEPLNREVVSIVIDAMRKIQQDQYLAAIGSIDAQTHLFGSSGAFDSLALVTLVVEVEQRLQSRFGVLVSLADDRALSQESSPFLTVGSFARYASALVEERLAAEGKYG